mmetsp:Transcript_25683/g.55250  ORF Transcript_25683/g.55250 Transcript_25683/m.55250 type:complete len:661 (-) Transcript_25683:16-1998(-)
MPALKVIGCWGTQRSLTTRPFAGDDLQVLCIFTAAYRVIQVACIIPFWIRLFLFRLHGRSFVAPNGYPSWCQDDLEPIDTINSLYGNSSVSDEERNMSSGPYNYMVIPLTFYLSVSVLYTVLDIALSLAIWSASSVGTPTEPRGRDKVLPPLIWTKTVFMNFLLVVVLTSGIYFVSEGRRTNYGCGEDDALDQFEDTPWYAMFSVVMFTYAFELLLWPCICMNQIGKSIRSETSKSRLYRYFLNKDRSHKNTAAFLGGCFKCLQCLSCNRLGGGKIRAQSDLKDAAFAFMDFFNLAGANFDIVPSDMWLAFKMLGRVHRERKYQLSEQARMDKERNKEGQLVPQLDFGFMNENNDDDGATDNNCYDEHDLFDAEDKFWIQNTRQKYSPSINDEDDNNVGTAKKSVLRYTQASDMYHIRQAARYSHYALGVYDHYPDALLAAGQLVGGRTGDYRPTAHPIVTDDVSLFSCFRLTDFGFPKTALVYATFANDIIATPYAILVDEEEKSVVVSICGTATLEDLVTDLQFSPAKMQKVGEVCGFDGKETYAHKGMLTKCKWIYNDLSRRKILSRLLPTGDVKNKNNPCHDFKLIFTGHSLGAGIAAILGAMFRPTYPSLKCYAYCPPGCSVSMNFALQCEDFVTSIVLGNDIIPRIRGPNFEML